MAKVRYRYDEVRYIMILYTARRWHGVDPNDTFDSQKALTGELWAVYCEYFGEFWPHFNGTALYLLPEAPLFNMD